LRGLKIHYKFSKNIPTLLLTIKTTNMQGTIVSLILGAVAGWLGGQLYKGSGLGIIGNIIVGILGGFVGYWGLGKLGVNLGTGWVGYILTAAIGAVVLLALLNLIVKKK
jgi:uncharacterized membrane protein YeaQ/YmgE (transglycosylase-associated protein family)